MLFRSNVAAAEELIARRRPLLFRVHEEPSPEKLESLREVALASGFTLAKGQVLHTRHLNALLGRAKDTEFSELINLATLRSMTQAYYKGENFGRSEEHTSELQSRRNLVCRLLLEKKKQ